MFGILIYIILPVVFLLHDAEELISRKKWEEKNSRKVVTLFPKVASLLSHLREMGSFRLTLIVLEQLLLIVFAVVLGIYVDPLLMVAVFWGFILHLLVHLAESILCKMYVPGLATSILLIPYGALGIYDLSCQYSFLENLSLAVLGFTLVILNLLFVHLLLSKV